MNEKPARKFFSMGEILSLFGMGVAVMSAALTWGSNPPPVTSAVGAYFIRDKSFLVSGFDKEIGSLRVGWVVVVCALICGALLLWEPKGRQKTFFFTLQTALGLTILLLAFIHIGVYVGVILAFVGGALLLAGAFVRYR
jgi:hypothetical protein